MGWRLARQTITVANNAGAVERLELPFIERQIIIPQFFQFTLGGVPPATFLTIAVSHDLDSPIPTSGFTLILENPDVWIHHIWGANEVVTVERDLRGYELELAGPQMLVAEQGASGAAIEVHCKLWYATRDVSLQEWSAVARRTTIGG